MIFADIAMMLLLHLDDAFVTAAADFHFATFAMPLPQLRRHDARR